MKTSNTIDLKTISCSNGCGEYSWNLAVCPKCKLPTVVNILENLVKCRNDAAKSAKAVSQSGATVKTPGNGNFCKSFFHPCIPPTATAQQRRHARNGHSYMPANVRKAQQQLAAIFSQYAPGNPAVGPITVFLSITYPHISGTRRADKAKEIPKVTRPDCDNLAKLMLDAATDAGWWTDDSQVTELNIRKLNGPEPGIKFSVKGVE